MPRSTATAHAELLRSTFAALTAGDLDTCLQRISPDFLMNLAGSPEPLVGRDLWLRGTQALRTGFPDLSIEVAALVADDELVAVRNILRGTHTGPFDGLAPTGRTIEVMSNEFYRIEDGTIMEEWVVTDLTTLHQQLTPPS